MKQYVKSYFKKNWVYIILFALIILQLSQLLFWIISTDSNPSYDEAWHLTNAHIYQEKLFGNGSVEMADLNEKSYGLFGHGFNAYIHPNFFYFLSSLFPLEYNWIVALNSLFLIILILSTFGIGKELFGKKEGILSAFFITSYPSIIGISRNYLLDTPVAALVALTVYLYLKSNNLKNKLYTSFFFISFLLAMFTKQSALLFLAPLFIFQVISFLQTKEKKKIITGSLFTVIFIGLFHLLLYLSKMDIYKYLPALDFLSKFKAHLFLDNFLRFVNHQLSLVYFLIFVFGFLIIFSLKKHRLILLLLVSPILYLFLFNYAHVLRYNLPVLYIIAIISSVAIMKLPKHILKFKKITITRLYIIVVIILLGLIQFTSLAFDVPVINQNVIVGNKVNILTTNFDKYYEFIKPGDMHRTNITHVLEIITTDAELNQFKSIKICNIGESLDTSWVSLLHYIIKDDYPFAIAGNGCDPTNYHYVTMIGGIESKKAVNKHNGWVGEANRKSQTLIMQSKDNFLLLGNVSKLFIYRNELV